MKEREQGGWTRIKSIIFIISVVFTGVFQFHRIMDGGSFVPALPLRVAIVSVGVAVMLLLYMMWFKLELEDWMEFFFFLMLTSPCALSIQIPAPYDQALLGLDVFFVISVYFFRVHRI